MHPAPSVIVFTTLSGAGFGLLFWLGLGLPAVTGRVAFALFAIAFTLAAGGLMASTFHLGHPERAWKAFSQWRSSWLSREGVCAVAALLIMAAYGAGLVFFGARLVALGYVLPVALLALPFSHALAALAALCHLVGIAAARWLFFAEAEHVVGFYYGKR